MAQVRVRETHLATLVLAQGEFDLGNVSRLRSALGKALEGTPAAVIVDFADVTFADSTVLGVLVGAHRRAAANTTPLYVVAPAKTAVRKVLDLTRLTALLPVCDSIDAALKAVGPSSRQLARASEPQTRAS